jgi:hypothetical protein
MPRDCASDVEVIATSSEVRSPKDLSRIAPPWRIKMDVRLSIPRLPHCFAAALLRSSPRTPHLFLHEKRLSARRASSCTTLPENATLIRERERAKA